MDSVHQAFGAFSEAALNFYAKPSDETLMTFLNICTRCAFGWPSCRRRLPRRFRHRRSNEWGSPIADAEPKSVQLKGDPRA